MIRVHLFDWTDSLILVVIRYTILHILLITWHCIAYKFLFLFLRALGLVVSEASVMMYIILTSLGARRGNA